MLLRRQKLLDLRTSNAKVESTAFVQGGVFPVLRYYETSGELNYCSTGMLAARNVAALSSPGGLN